jgi:hypothetical protein
MGAGQTERVAQHPQQGRIGVDVDAVRGAVHFDREGHGHLVGQAVGAVAIRLDSVVEV